MLLVPRLQTLIVCADRDRMQGYVCLLRAVTMAYISFSRGLHVRLWPAPEGHGHVPPIVQHYLQHRDDCLVGGVCGQDEPSVRINEVQTHYG